MRPWATQQRWPANIGSPENDELSVRAGLDIGFKPDQQRRDSSNVLKAQRIFWVIARSRLVDQEADLPFEPLKLLRIHWQDECPCRTGVSAGGKPKIDQLAALLDNLPQIAPPPVDPHIGFVSYPTGDQKMICRECTCHCKPRQERCEPYACLRIAGPNIWTHR